MVTQGRPGGSPIIATSTAPFHPVSWSWIEDWRMFCPAVDRRGPVALHSTAAAELLNGPFSDDIPDAPD